MKEIKGNIFNLILKSDVDSICITTNGIVNANGLAIMGAGIAGAAAKRYPSVRENLGKSINKFGNVPFVIGILDNDNNFKNPNKKEIESKNYKCLIWSFPTKNHWKDNSDIELIKKSALLLVKSVNNLELKNIYLPRPGCSLGGLSWVNVKKVIEPILDDRFTIVSFEGEE